LADPAWREVALLAVGYLGIIQQRDEAAGAVVEALAALQDQAPEAVVLAGEATLDARPGGVPVVSRERVKDALVPVMQSAEVPFVLRHQAGLILGRLGWRPADLDSSSRYPPAGSCMVIRSKNARYCTPPDRQVSVTNAQYAHFVEAGAITSSSGGARKAGVGARVQKADLDAYQRLYGKDGGKQIADYVDSRTEAQLLHSGGMMSNKLTQCALWWARLVFEAEAYCTG